MSTTVVSARKYLFTYFALLGLTLATTLVAYLDLGWATMLIAILFALAKATLIASIFMHVLYEGKLVKLAIAGAVIWFVILVSLTINDYITRGWLGFGGK
jgi:cytochrome c oxidase subunit 4